MSDASAVSIGVAGSAFTVRRAMSPVPPSLVTGLRALRDSGARSVTVFLSRTHRSFLSLAHARVLVAELAAIGATEAAEALDAFVGTESEHPWLCVDPLP